MQNRCITQTVGHIRKFLTLAETCQEDIPGQSETMVDCGSSGYVSRPQPGLTYLFPPANKNYDFVAYVRGKALSHTKTTTTAQCQGILACPSCRFRHRPATTQDGIEKQIKTLECFYCKSKTLCHVPCTHQSVRCQHSDGSHTLQGIGAHSDHEQPPNIRPPQSVMKSQLLTMLLGGVGFLGHAVRTGTTITQHDVDKGQRWKREAERQLHPGGTGLEACAKFNEENRTEYILGDVAVEGFSCATVWQRWVISDIIRELLDPNIKDEDRQWDGWSFNDLTYSITENMYMQTMMFYNFKWKMTVLVTTKWFRGLTAMHYV